MKRFPAGLVAVCLVAAGAAGQTVTLPKEVVVPAGRLAAVTVTSDGADTKWTADDGLDVFREYDPDPKVIRLRVIGYANGRYKLKAITTKGDKLSEWAECVVLVGGAPPPPDPTPPPIPVPDALTRQLQAAYDADPAPDKAERMGVFADVMAEAVKMCADPKYTTNAELVAAIKSLTTSKIADSLSGVRAEVGRYLNARLPAGVVQMDATRRPTFVEHYSAVAKSSKAVRR